MHGRPIFDYPDERRAVDGEGCETCGIVLEGDAIGSYCSPECCEYEDRCGNCQRGPSWCECGAAWYPNDLSPMTDAERRIEKLELEIKLLTRALEAERIAKSQAMAAAKSVSGSMVLALERLQVLTDLADASVLWRADAATTCRSPAEDRLWRKADAYRIAKAKRS